MRKGTRRTMLLWLALWALYLSIVNVGQVFYGRIEPTRYDMRKTTTGLSIDSQVGIAGLHGDRKRSVGMLLSHSDVSLSPGEVHIRPTWNAVINSINLTTF